MSGCSYSVDVRGTMSADVDVFSGALNDCESFEFTNTGFGNDYLSVNLSSKSCFVKDYHMVTPTLHPAPKSYVIWAVDSVECSGSSIGIDAIRVIIYRGDYNNSGLGRVPAWEPYITTLSGVLCSPSYQLSHRSVSQGELGTLDVSHSLGSSTSFSISESESVPITKSVIRSMNCESKYFSPWFQLFSLEDPTYEPSKSLNDPQLLGRISKRLFPQMFAQWAKRRAKAVNATVAGYSTAVAGRLKVQSLALRLMEGILVSILAVSAALAFLLRQPVLRGDPGPLGFYASLLKSDSSTTRALEGTGELTMKAFRAKLCEANSETSEPAIPVPTPTESQTNVAGKIKWWQPLSNRPVYRVSICVIPVALVVALEVIYQISSKNTGIATVSTQGYTKYAWIFVPSSTMALIGLAFGTIDFSARMLYPYQALKKTHAHRAMSFDPFGRIALLVAFETLRYTEFVVFAAVLAILMAPLLTVVTSGLFTAQPVRRELDVGVRLDTWFDLNQTVREPNILTASAMDLSVAALVHYQNISFPQWTYEELSFPRLEIGNDQKAALPASPVPLRVRLPATRGRMNCSVSASYKNLNLSLPSPGELLHEFPKVLTPLPCTIRSDNGTTLNCAHGLPDSYSGSSMITSVDGLRGTGSPGMKVFAGPAREMYGINTQNNRTMDIEDQQLVRQPCRDGRLHMWYMVGHGDQFFFPELSVIDCTPYAEVVYVDATFTLHTFQFDTSHPPIIDEQSTRIVSVSNSTIFNVLEPISVNAVVFDPSANFSDHITPLFQAVVSGAFADGTTLDDLLTEPGLPTLLKRMETLWGHNMAQVLQTSHGVPWSSLSDGARDAWAVAPEVTGTVVDSVEHLRLMQSAVSTRILEVLLLLMAGCGVVVVVLERKTKILPKDPGSIAAKMSLFAGSELVQMIPEGAGRWDEKAWGLEGHFFSLGWWPAKEGGRRRFGIDVGRAEES